MADERAIRTFGQLVLDHALEEACELVREQTVLPVFDGTPE